MTNKIKFLFFIAFIFLGITNVRAATNITPKNGIWNASGIYFTGGDNWEDGLYMSNKSYGTQGTLADDLTDLGRMRFYSYYNSGVMTSANSYTFKYKVCSDIPSGYYIYNGKSRNSSSWINGNFNDFKKGVEVFSYFYNTTSEAITGAANGDPAKIVAEVQTVSGENNCIYQIFSVTPESTYRAVGFQVRYNSEYGDLTSAMGKYTVSLVSLTQQEGVAGIVRTGFEKTHEDLENINDTINDDDTSAAEDTIGDFFQNFTTNDHGLSSIITAPLTAIQSLTSATCSPIVLPLPFMTNKNLTLPCMRPIYDQHFGAFMQLYDVITFGIVGYWVCVRIFTLVKDFKNPEHDEVEVMDL